MPAMPANSGGPVMASGQLILTVDIHYTANGVPDRIDVANIDENGAPYPNGVLRTQIGYDVLDDVVSTTQEIDGATNAVTGFQRDSEQNVETITLPEGNQVRIAHDARGFPQASTRGFGSPDAATTMTTFDGNQNLAEMVFGEGGNHKLVRTINGFDVVASEIDGLGHHTDTLYNATSTPVQVTRVEAGGAVLERSTLGVDELERVFQVDRLFSNSAGAAVGDGIARTSFLLDRNSRVTRMTDDNTQATNMFWDDANRWFRMVDPVGNQVERVLDPSGNTLETIATEHNEHTGVPALTRTGAQFDSMNRPTLVTQALGSLNLQTQLKWDSRSQNVLSIDAEGRTTRQDFDGRGLPLARVFDVGGLNISVGNAWDRNGNLVASSDANGNTTTYEQNPRDLTKRVLMRTGRRSRSLTTATMR